MGNSASVVVAEIVMQNIEEQALATYKRTIPLWLRYVDDRFTAVHKDEIDDFHEHLNRQNAENCKKNFSRLHCHSPQQQTTNDNLHKTDTYRPIDKTSHRTTRPLARLQLNGL